LPQVFGPTATIGNKGGVGVQVLLQDVAVFPAIHGAVELLHELNERLFGQRKGVVLPGNDGVFK
jgi:hypothetical protein